MNFRKVKTLLIATAALSMTACNSKETKTEPIAKKAPASTVAKKTDKKVPQILIKNVMLWNGLSKNLKKSSVLIENNLTKKIGATEKDIHSEAQIIDGMGKTLMPGLIDMHSHLCLQEGMLAGRDSYDMMAMGARAAVSMRQYLDQGFTTAMDLGCNILSLAKAVNRGLVPGPRIFPSGGFLSQTGGHADTGTSNDNENRVDNLEKHGLGFIADGVPEVMKAARVNLRNGATQIKVMAGGGVASEFDPLHTVQYSLEEMKAIVGVAQDYGTFVTVHAYHDKSVNRAIDAGARLIQHNFLVSEKTIKRMKREKIGLSVQAVMSLEAFGDPDSITFFNADQKAKAKRVNAGASRMMKWALKHDLIMVTGGDMFGPAYNTTQARNMTMLKTIGYPNLKILKMGTSDAGEVLKWVGEMSPYKEGTIGTITPGAYADMILVDGNPIKDIEVLNRYKESFKVIIKDGKIWKNTL
jgi:imidazolonepropionase-like amidohydrolase